MISLVLVALAGVFNAVMDVLNFKFHSSIFRFWNNQQWINPSLSSANKWKYENSIWAGERFFGSSTFLVFITDMWHLSKFLMLLLITSSVVFYHPIINWYVDWLLMYVCFTATFEIFYSKIFIKH
jgi:hypothetical protein